MIHKKYLSYSRKRISFFIIPLILASLIFILYQISIFVQLSGQPKLLIKSVLIRGTHELQASFYQQNEDNTFICIHSMEVIHYDRINDNYCDCMDGSDEPGTNACSNGIFYCANQKRIPKSIHSSKVNDGICDCCDGSDEWKNNKLDKLPVSETLQKSAYHNHPPCRNVC